jgi:glutamyl/glutaminyl-tRNA synthetase
VNFVSLLGWSPSNSDEELFTLEQLVERFSLDQVNRAGCIVNQRKLDWFESAHLQRLLSRQDPTQPPNSEYLRVRDQLHERVGQHVPTGYLECVIDAVLVRMCMCDCGIERERECVCVCVWD